MSDNSAAFIPSAFIPSAFMRAKWLKSPIRLIRGLQRARTTLRPVLPSFALAIGLGALALSPTAAAQFQQPGEVRIADLTPLDRQYMARQAQVVDELARLHLGTACCDSRADLSTLQRMLDEGVVRNDQRSELQAMGIVMGNLLAGELGLHWVIYEDEMGRSRALRLDETDNYLFPATMLSRRREFGNEEPVEVIYEQAYRRIEARLPPKPYQ